MYNKRVSVKLAVVALSLPFYYALLPPHLPSNAGGDVACFGDNEGTGGPHKDQESLRVQEPPLSTAG